MSGELFGKLSIISMKGCEQFTEQVNKYLKEWRVEDNFLVSADCRGSAAARRRGLSENPCGGMTSLLFATPLTTA